MTIDSDGKSRNPSGFVEFRPYFNRLLNLLHRTLLVSALVSLIWSSALFINPALAAPIVSARLEGNALQISNLAAESDRMITIIDCLPKQLSQPSLKRALSEMSNDQLERAFNLKANPKLSQAEVELNSCLSR